MNCVQKEEKNRIEARKLADKLTPLFEGRTMDVALQALDFIRARLERDLRYNTPLRVIEDE